MSKLEEALQLCRDTCIGPLPCTTLEYLRARVAYHKLLVERGMLDPKLAEKEPRK